MTLGMKHCKDCKQWYMDHHTCTQAPQPGTSQAETSGTHERSGKGGGIFKCKRCGKTFSRKSNLSKHEKTHSNKDLHTCSRCNKTFMYHKSLKNHMKKHHKVSNEDDITEDEGATPSGLKITDTLYIRSKSETLSKKFNTKIRSYAIKVKDDIFEKHLFTIPEIYDILRQIFTEILENTIPEEVHDHDYLRVILQASSLDYPIQIPFTLYKNLNVDLILSEIERVLQSYEEFVIDGEFEITVAHIKMPYGGKPTGSLWEDSRFG